MKNFGRNILFWLVAATLMFMLLDSYSSSTLKEELTYSEFKKEVQAKKVKTMTGQVATSPEMNPKVDYKY